MFPYDDPARLARLLRAHGIVAFDLDLASAEGDVEWGYVSLPDTWDDEAGTEQLARALCGDGRYGFEAGAIIASGSHDAHPIQRKSGAGRPRARPQRSQEDMLDGN